MNEDSLVMIKDKEIYMDGYLEDALIIYKNAVLLDDFDFLGLVDGRVGVGKSTFAIQLAKWCDPTFNLDRIVFTAQDFEQAVLKAKKFEAIVFDEAIEGFAAADFYKFMNRKLNRLMTKIRKKNLFIFIVMPSFFELKKDIAIYRSNCLFHCYLVPNKTNDRFLRGQFLFFNYEDKKNLYILGKEMLNHNAQAASFYGRFTKYFAVNKQDYEDKKDKYLINIEPEKKENSRERRLRIWINAIINNLSKDGYSQEEIAKLTANPEIPPTSHQNISNHSEKEAQG